MDTIFKEVSATIASANQVRSIFEEARDELQLAGRFVIIIVYPLFWMVTEVNVLGERLSFSMRSIVLPVLNRFQCPITLPGLLLTHTSGYLHPFHRTGFCASKQYLKDFNNERWILTQHHDADHRSDHRESFLRIKSDATQLVSVRSRRPTCYVLSHDIPVGSMSLNAWPMKM